MEAPILRRWHRGVGQFGLTVNVCTRRRSGEAIDVLGFERKPPRLYRLASDVTR